MAPAPGAMPRSGGTRTSGAWPLGFFSYGGMVAIQTLWAGPWMVRVAAGPLQAATGLFWINACMLCTFWTWGCSTRLARAASAWTG
jgi:hypothetical protein